MNRTGEDGANRPVFVARAKRQQLAPDHVTPRDRGHRREKDMDTDRYSDEQRKRDRKLEEDLELIKEHYLGTKKPKRHVPKPSEKTKMRFRFDWENTEDTSRDAEKVTEARLLFGRGFLGGIDKREQKKQKSGAGNDRHWSEKKVEEMTERDWRIFREDFNISYKGSRVPPPIRSWIESKLSDAILNAVEDAGYKTPSAIQMAAIPLGLHQRDVIGIASTGSGKTAAFVLPMLSYISKLPKATAEGGPYAVVMAPTRELAQQIKDWTVKLSRYLREIRAVLVVGGQPIQEQSTLLGRGCEIIIATPGRLLECLEEHFVVLNQCNYVVLDEADRMIEQGFEEQIIRVLDRIPSSNLKPHENEDEDLGLDRIYRTTYMFSATMPPAVERLARKYLRNHVVVNVEAARNESHLITQNVVWVNENLEKPKRLRRILDGLADETAIVFVNERKNADAVFKSLHEYYRVTVLHAGMSQQQRDVSLEGFRTKKYNVMVATNVLGRGIDIPNIAHVINYDMPTNIQDYTHRIGRTGRAGRTGVATTFLTRYDASVFYDLKQMLVQSKSCVPRELAKVKAPDFKPADRQSKEAVHMYHKYLLLGLRIIEAPKEPQMKLLRCARVVRLVLVPGTRHYVEVI